MSIIITIWEQLPFSSYFSLIIIIHILKQQ